MKKNDCSMRFLQILFILLLLSCQNRKLISDKNNPHDPEKIDQYVLREDLKEDYISHFKKQKIKPLKKEWRSLYDYAKKGHILRHKSDNELLIFSYEFYRYYALQQMRPYLTPFMHKYDNIVAIFGQPNDILTNNKSMLIAYAPWYPDTCTTCPHPSGFDLEFNLETKLRIVPDWIQKKIDADKE